MAFDSIVENGCSDIMTEPLSAIYKMSCHCLFAGVMFFTETPFALKSLQSTVLQEVSMLLKAMFNSSCSWVDAKLRFAVSALLLRIGIKMFCYSAVPDWEAKGPIFSVCS